MFTAGSYFLVNPHLNGALGSVGSSGVGVNGPVSGGVVDGSNIMPATLNSSLTSCTSSSSGGSDVGGGARGKQTSGMNDDGEQQQQKKRESNSSTNDEDSVDSASSASSIASSNVSLSTHGSLMSRPDLASHHHHHHHNLFPHDDTNLLH